MKIFRLLKSQAHGVAGCTRDPYKFVVVAQIIYDWSLRYAICLGSTEPLIPHGIVVTIFLNIIIFIIFVYNIIIFIINTFGSKNFI